MMKHRLHSQLVTSTPHQTAIRTTMHHTLTISKTTHYHVTFIPHQIIIVRTVGASV